MLSLPTMKFFTKRGSLPRVMPSMSCSTSTCPEQSTPAPMPMVGIGSGDGDFCCERRRNQLQHQQRSTRVGKLAGVRLQCAAASSVLFLNAVAASACTDCGVSPRWRTPARRAR